MLNIMKIVTKGCVQWRKHESKLSLLHYNTGIGEKYGGAGASIIKKNERILNGVGVPKQQEVSPSFSGCNLVEHPIIKHGITVIKQQCLSKVLVDELVGFPQCLTVILRRQQKNPNSNKMDLEMAEWATESEESLFWGQEDIVSELEALDILLTW